MNIPAFTGCIQGKGEGRMSIDQEKLNQFMQRAVGDLGATFHAALIVIGDKLGQYRAMAENLNRSVLCQ
jgi:copper homeostasis protein CutC